MAADSLTQEHRIFLEVLRQNPGIKLREIHDNLVEVEGSRFEYSPEFGEGWNEERREIRELEMELAEQGLIKNEYQTWYLTQDGRDALL